MIKELNAPPKFWLNLDLCEKLYENLRNTLSFDEPIPPFSTRFEDRLESILGSVEQSFEGQYLNTTVLEVAAAYFYQISTGHAFKNGNKRMAVLFTHTFLLMNGFDFIVSNKDLYKFAVEVVVLSSGHNSQTIKEVIKDYIVVSVKKSKLRIEG